MLPGIAIILKDVSHNDFSVNNNIGGHFILYNFISTPFPCCFNIILLQPDIIAYFFKDRIFSQYQVGSPCHFHSDTNMSLYNILSIVVETNVYRSNPLQICAAGN